MTFFLGNFSCIESMEDVLKPMIGNESLHEINTMMELE
jgi:hypothetical protein